MGQKVVIVAAVLLIAVGIAFAALPKDWIEETVGFEPDGGNGMVELLIALVPIVAGACLLALAFVRSARHAQSVTPTQREV